ncbi:uncharacterized protein J7T54_005959 [Emericellopsis cladophorae]|uniref:Uncharacterized protein n=1 Tax=Emericellopsis cladophorae TaxID=2686198 RepID=A0A9P9Y9P8_9HYPO|nr:uncharacterized protein J7T54_005959 [Emericellopsis cladophorae]KAI6785625.1 hypothetical protein J7T54_005959 [Emericellopsis cladophorae]
MWHRLSSAIQQQSPAATTTTTTTTTKARDDPDTQLWQDRFDDRIERLAKSSEGGNRPHRFEIQQGKAVPSSSDTPLALREYLPSSTSSSTPEAAPRPRQFPRTSDWRQRVQPAPPPPVNGEVAVPKLVVSDDHCDKRQPQSDEMASLYYTQLQQQQKAINTDGVSLPSSPELSPENSPYYNDNSVSPMEEDDADVSRQYFIEGANPLAQHPAANSSTATSPALRSSGQHPSSSIPTMKRQQQKLSDADAVAPRPRANRDTHLRAGTPPIESDHTSRNAVGWEDPTDQMHPRPESTEPRDEAPMYGMKTTVTAQLGQRSRNPPPSLGQRVRQQLGKGKTEPIENRPAWQGASGRETVVKPVQDKTSVPPLQVPPKSSKRAERARDARTQEQHAQPIRQSQQAHDMAHGSSKMAALRKFMPHRHNQVPPQPQGRASFANEPATDNVAAVNATTTTDETGMDMSSSMEAPDSPPQIRVSPHPPRLTIPNPDKAIKRKPPPNAANSPAHVVHPSISSSVYSTQPDHPTLTTSPQQITSTPPLLEDSRTQPPSQLSSTRYPTSADDTTSRRSNEEQVPPVSEPASSVMDRRRPVPGRDSPQTVPHDPLVISLKSATTSDHASTPRSIAHDKPVGRPMSIMSTSKDLPPAPPEMVDTKDRVVLLKTKLEALAHRRNNISRSIKKMTELMPADRLMASHEVLRKREEEKRKVEVLREELAEVQRQEYDLGLKLHRAYKRQEREANYETGTLWVRRVTS